MHHESELGGIALGESGIHILPADRGVKMLKAGKVAADNLLLVGGVVRFGPGEVANVLAADEMRVVLPGKQLSNL